VTIRSVAMVRMTMRVAGASVRCMVLLRGLGTDVVGLVRREAEIREQTLL
jgi:hypothetical protein